MFMIKFSFLWFALTRTEDSLSENFEWVPLLCNGPYGTLLLCIFRSFGILDLKKPCRTSFMGTFCFWLTDLRASCQYMQETCNLLCTKASACFFFFLNISLISYTSVKNNSWDTLLLMLSLAFGMFFVGYKFQVLHVLKMGSLMCHPEFFSKCYSSAVRFLGNGLRYMIKHIYVCLYTLSSRIPWLS